MEDIQDMKSFLNYVTFERDDKSCEVVESLNTLVPGPADGKLRKPLICVFLTFNWSKNHKKDQGNILRIHHSTRNGI